MTNDNFHFREIGGVKYLYRGDNIIQMYYNVSVVYDDDLFSGTKTRMKVVEKESAERWIYESNEKVKNSPFMSLDTFNFQMITDEDCKFDIYDLTNLINNSTFIDKFVDKYAHKNTILADVLEV